MLFIHHQNFFVLFCFHVSQSKKRPGFILFSFKFIYSLFQCVCVWSRIPEYFVFSEINDTLKTFFSWLLDSVLGMNNDHQQQTFIIFIWFLIIIIIIYNQANINSWQFETIGNSSTNFFSTDFMSVYNFELFFRCWLRWWWWLN